MIADVRWTAAQELHHQVFQKFDNESCSDFVSTERAQVPEQWDENMPGEGPNGSLREVHALWYPRIQIAYDSSLEIRQSEALRNSGTTRDECKVDEGGKQSPKRNRLQA